LQVLVEKSAFNSIFVELTMNRVCLRDE